MAVLRRANSFSGSFLFFKVYSIVVSHGVLGTTHVIRRRFSDFVQLQKEVEDCAGVALPLPPKRVFGNSDAMFLAKRKDALQVGKGGRERIE